MAGPGLAVQVAAHLRNALDCLMLGDWECSARVTEVIDTMVISNKRQRETHDRNVDLPTSASPRRRIGTSGASMAASAITPGESLATGDMLRGLR